VTPTLNAERYVTDNLRSVHDLQGTACDFEQVVIDGGSDDGTVDAVNEFKQTHSSKITLLQEKDRNMYDAINRGLRLITGDIWACLNADDQYEPQIFSRIVQEFTNNPKLEGTYGFLERVDSDGKHLFTYYSPEISLSYFVRRGLCVGITQPTTFLRRSVISTVGMFNTEYAYSSDYDYLIRVLRLCNVSRIPAVITKFREHSDSFSVRPLGRQRQVAESQTISKSFMKEYHISRQSTLLEDSKNFITQIRPGNTRYLLLKIAQYMRGITTPLRDITNS
jgi:glycosyltransferase involved in cell wall biosynthesis